MIQTLAQPTTKKQVNLLVRLNESYQKLSLYLDLEQYSQKIMWSYLSNGKYYEPEESKFLEKVLKPGDGFIDIGAHIGYYSLLASILVGSEGKVYSIEPDDTNVEWIADHIALNEANNIHVIQTVLGDDAKEVEFYFNSDNDGGHALWDVGLHSFNQLSRDRRQTLTLQMSTVDEVFQNKELNRLKLIKIDAEGSEYNILRGAVNTLSTHKVPYIICEINRFALQQMGTNEGQLREFMESLGYSTYLLRAESPQCVKLLPSQYYNSQYVFNLVFALE